MNTRFAAIAGTLLVGISLFVTSLISQNLTNSALTTTSQAAGVGGTCQAFATCENCTSGCSGRQCTKKITQVGCKYIDEGGNEVIVPLPTDMLLPTQPYTGDGNPRACLQGNSCSVYAAKLSLKFQRWCNSFCDGTRRAPINSPIPSATSAPGTGPVCRITIPVGGSNCDPGIGICCAAGSFCIDLGAAGKHCLGMSPTPGAFGCINGPYRGSIHGCSNPDPRAIGGNPCCAPRTCRVVAEYPGPTKSYDIDCILPTLTPTPSPTPGVGSCFDPCFGNAPGQCIEGSCRSVSDPGNPNPDCRTKGDCKCVKNDTCKDDKSKDCFCFDPRSCPNIDEGDVVFCGCLARNPDGTCINKLPDCEAPLVCDGKDGNLGICTSKYCLRPTPTPHGDPIFRSPIQIEREAQQRIDRILRVNPDLSRQELESLPYQLRRSVGLE